MSFMVPVYELFAEQRAGGGGGMSVLFHIGRAGPPPVMRSVRLYERL